MSNTLRAAGVVIAASFLLSCGQRGAVADAYQNAVTPAATASTGRAAAAMPRKVSPAAAVNSIDFYGRWWTEEQMTSNFDAGNPPPMEGYFKLEDWRASSSNDFPHPDLIDIACTVENKGAYAADFHVSSTAEFKVAAGHDEYDKTLDELLADVPWTEQTPVGEEVVRNLLPGETRAVKFKDFSVGSIINKYFVDPEDDRWPWRLRVHVTIKTPNGTKINESSAVLDLIPAD